MEENQRSANGFWMAWVWWLILMNFYFYGRTCHASTRTILHEFYWRPSGDVARRWHGKTVRTLPLQWTEWTPLDRENYAVGMDGEGRAKARGKDGTRETTRRVLLCYFVFLLNKHLINLNLWFCFCHMSFISAIKRNKRSKWKWSKVEVCSCELCSICSSLVFRCVTFGKKKI
jgi:hypothetical protein